MCGDPYKHSEILSNGCLGLGPGWARPTGEAAAPRACQARCSLPSSASSVRLKMTGSVGREELGQRKLGRRRVGGAAGLTGPCGPTLQRAQRGPLPSTLKSSRELSVLLVPGWGPTAAPSHPASFQRQ